MAARKAELWGVMASSQDSAAVEEAKQEAALLQKRMPEMGWSSQQCADRVKHLAKGVSIGPPELPVA